MKHIAALSIKLAAVTFILLIVLSGFYNYPFLPTIGLSVVIVALSYVLGDIGILRFSNNIVATAADLGLTAIVIWLIGPLFYGIGVSFAVAIFAAIMIGVIEYIYHIYIANHVLEKNADPSPQS
ncbi:hypothetical protein J2S74_003204 [Evansella vedderi]|uniref:DUF2512 family protein n=1 Tax=Evansella vedderi TaxID=38282 RepID=A0ABT9ZYL2_9BACI|nr:DUF2512 family protein [Evansella vedderi]MDQ0255822.1 hypothetical protein [Evansella vedderi]